MTNIDVIAMAREASDPDKVDPWHNGFWVLTQKELERFVDLIASLVRADAIAEEREACAKVCEELDIGGWRDAGWDMGTLDCAAAIRARSNT